MSPKILCYLKKLLLPIMLLQVSTVYTEPEVQQAAPAPVAPSIEPNWSDYLFDWDHGEFIGGREVAPDIEKFVRNILHELRSPLEHTLRVRKLSNVAIYNGCTKYNAFVTSYGDNSYMFISEKWFRKLSEEEKRFLIGHEIMHLHCKHEERMATKVFGYCTLVGGAAFLVVLPITLMFSKGNIEEDLAITGVAAIVPWLISLCVFPGYISRSHESEADREAALHLNCAKGGIGVMKRLQAFSKECKADLPQWKWCKIRRKIRKVLSKPFQSHPPTKERIKQLEALVQ